MKKILILAVLVFGLAGAAQAQGERQVLADLGPSLSSGTVSSAFELTLSSGGANVRNCLTEMTILSDTAYTVTIYDGGDTALPPIWEQAFSADAGITKDWGFFTALCGSKNTQMTIDVSAGTYRLTHKGYRF